MEVFQLFSCLIFLAIAAFLFFEERNFKKNLIKIEGRLVGFSKGKSQANKRFVYPVIEFMHPSGVKGWVEGHKMMPLNNYGAKVSLVADRIDPKIVRTASSVSITWVIVLCYFAFLEFATFISSEVTDWLPLAVCVLLVALVVYASKETWRENNDNFKIVSYWREWRLQILKSRVYIEPELSNIRLWTDNECSKFFKNANRMRLGFAVYSLVLIGGLFLFDYSQYSIEEQFYATAKRTTATVVDVAPNGKPIFEYYDIEGISHRIQGRYSLTEIKMKVGESRNVFYSPHYYRTLRADTSEKTSAIWFFGFPFFFCGLMFWNFRRMPKLDITQKSILAAVAPVIKSAG